MSAKKKPPKDYPLRICSLCADLYTASGFSVEYAEPRIMRMDKCSLCEQRRPVWPARLEGRPPKKPPRRR